MVERAEAQGGLLRWSDLDTLGYHRRHVRRLVVAGRLHELHRGVYALGHRAISRRAQFLAAVWWVGADAVLSHDSAVAFYGWVIEDPEQWPPIHVSTTRQRVRSSTAVIVHRTRHLDHRDAIDFGLLPVTDRVRTLIDHADGVGYEELRAVADQLPSLPKRRLIEARGRMPNRAGAERTHRLIHSEDAHPRSAMERRFVRYCNALGVPHPDRRNVRVHGIAVDCWYAGPRLVVELDSRAHHTRRRQFEADRLRDRALKRQGIDTLRLTWHDLDPTDPQAAHDLRQRLHLVS